MYELVQIRYDTFPRLSVFGLAWEALLWSAPMFAMLKFLGESTNRAARGMRVRSEDL